MDFVALITILAAVSIALWWVGRAIEPPRLVELFRTSHELGWPVGVQEEDLPPAFGSRIQPPNAIVHAEAESLKPTRSLFDRAVVGAAGAGHDQAWSGRIRDVRLVAGTARR